MKTITGLLSILSVVHTRLLPPTKVLYSPSLTVQRTAENTILEEEEGPGDRKCYKKVMMVEQVEYQEVETCNHSYDKVGLGR